MRRWSPIALNVVLLFGTGLLGYAPPAAADGPYAVVTGRRDPRLIVIDLGRVSDPANNATSNAIVNRVRVSPDVPSIDPARVDAPLIGVQMKPADALPNNITIPPGSGRAFVVNHAGVSRPDDVESGMPHGYPGTLAVLDLAKLLDPGASTTTSAMIGDIYTGGNGPAGVVVTPDFKFALIGNSEGNNNEDGASEIGVIDLEKMQLIHTLYLARGTGGQVAQSAGHTCAEVFVNPALVPHMSPDPNWGCFADPNGLAYTPRHGGIVFSANEGTHDVSVIDVSKAIAGASDFETFRVPVERGPWAIVASPDGGLVAVTNRDNDETDTAGRFVSIIDVEKAIARAADAEVARIRVGTDDPDGESRPFGLAFSPDGSHIVVANNVAGNVSVIDVQRAVSGADNPEIARIALTAPAGASALPLPRGVAVTPDGRLAAISGGGPNTKAGGVLWLVDLDGQKVVGTVTGVGNEPYLLSIVSGLP
jgi:DNA-binding beta-propeller fold protein YncE